MCIMEIHEESTRSAMIQAIAHNLSTIDRDLDMLRKVAESRKDLDLLQWAESLQDTVHREYADALMEFGLSIAEVLEDPNGHMPHVHDIHGNERQFADLITEVTNEAKADETR